MAESPPRTDEETAPDCEDQDEFPKRFGFRSGALGTHSSRTIMLADIQSLFAAVSKDAAKEDYRHAIIDGNVLGKKTLATRVASAKRLSELYNLDPAIPVHRLLRFFWELDREGRPLLAMLCAAARDPLLRAVVPAVLAVPDGELVTKDMLETALVASVPGRFNPPMIQKIARYVASSFTQSGHLQGRVVKRRARPVATAATAAYSLVLGYLAGSSGQMLLTTFWTRLLDVPSDRLIDLATEASRRGWIIFRRSGSVIEVRFPNLLTPEEEEARRGQD
jgi:hypothetical protein